MSADVTIVELFASPPHARAAALRQAEAIFFATASTTRFEQKAERSAFRRRWFASYAELFPESFLLAQSGGLVRGYLAGCSDIFAPKANAIVADIAYYTPAFKAAVKDHPAHFHINVQPGWQGRGIGRALLVRFFTQLCAQGIQGVHVVTGSGVRAIDFYRACGFIERNLQEGLQLALLVRNIEPCGRR